MIALGLAMTLITGEINISIGAVMAFSSVAFAEAMKTLPIIFVIKPKISTPVRVFKIFPRILPSRLSGSNRTAVYMSGINAHGIKLFSFAMTV